MYGDIEEGIGGEGSLRLEAVGDVFRDEQEKRRHNLNRTRMVACGLCFCCLLLVGAAIIAPLLVFGNGNDDDGHNPSTQVNPTLSPVVVVVDPTSVLVVEVPEPSPAPVTSPPTPGPTPATNSPTSGPTVAITRSPTTVPSDSPTTAPTTTIQPTQLFPEIITLEPFVDTQINLDGFFVNSTFGTDESFLVQKGVNDARETAKKALHGNSTMSKTQREKWKGRHGRFFPPKKKKKKKEEAQRRDDNEEEKRK